VPFAAGGPTDVIARQVAQKLGERLKQPVVIVNKPGAGRNLGSASVARSRKAAIGTWVSFTASNASRPTDGLAHTHRHSHLLHRRASCAFIRKLSRSQRRGHGRRPRPTIVTAGCELRRAGRDARLPVCLLWV